MKNLLRLNLSQNNIVDMPVCVSQSSQHSSFPSLTYFDLRSNQISSIPDSQVKLRNLETLLLSDNKLRSIPESFFLNLPSLKSIDISRNKIGNSWLHVLLSLIINVFLRYLLWTCWSRYGVLGRIESC